MRYFLVIIISLSLMSCNVFKKAGKRTERKTTATWSKVNIKADELSKIVTNTKTVTTEKVDTVLKGATKKAESKAIVLSELKPGYNNIPNASIAIYDSMGNALQEAKQALTDLTLILDTSTGTMRITAKVHEQDKSVKKEVTTTKDERREEDKKSTQKIEATRQEATTSEVKEKAKEVKRKPSFVGLLYILGAIAFVVLAVWVYVRRVSIFGKAIDWVKNLIGK